MIRRSALGVLGGPLALGFGFHPLEPLVVVGEFLHVRQRDLAGEDRIVVGDVGLRVVAAVLELDVHTGAELLEIEAAPVDADRVAVTRKSQLLLPSGDRSGGTGKSQVTIGWLACSSATPYSSWKTTSPVGT